MIQESRLYKFMQAEECSLNFLSHKDTGRHCGQEENNLVPLPNVGVLCLLYQLTWIFLGLKVHVWYPGNVGSQLCGEISLLFTGNSSVPNYLLPFYALIAFTLIPVRSLPKLLNPISDTRLNVMFKNKKTWGESRMNRGIYCVDR